MGGAGAWARDKQKARKQTTFNATTTTKINSQATFRGMVPVGRAQVALASPRRRRRRLGDASLHSQMQSQTRPCAQPRGARRSKAAVAPPLSDAAAPRRRAASLLAVHAA